MGAHGRRKGGGYEAMKMPRDVEVRRVSVRTKLLIAGVILVILVVVPFAWWRYRLERMRGLYEELKAGDLASRVERRLGKPDKVTRGMGMRQLRLWDYAPLDAGIPPAAYEYEYVLSSF